MAAEQQDTPGASGDVSVAQVIRRAALGVPGVAGLSGATAATAASGSPGDWEGALAGGVQYHRAETGLAVAVHLIALPVPLQPLAAAVRAAVATALALIGSPVAAVDVWVDVLVSAPGEETP